MTEGRTDQRKDGLNDRTDGKTEERMNTVTFNPGLHPLCGQFHINQCADVNNKATLLYEIVQIDSGWYCTGQCNYVN